MTIDDYKYEVINRTTRVAGEPLIAAVFDGKGEYLYDAAIIETTVTTINTLYVIERDNHGRVLPPTN
jgi:hypothetical protein